MSHMFIMGPSVVHWTTNRWATSKPNVMFEKPNKLDKSCKTFSPQCFFTQHTLSNAFPGNNFCLYLYDEKVQGQKSLIFLNLKINLLFLLYLEISLDCRIPISLRRQDCWADWTPRQVLYHKVRLYKWGSDTAGARTACSDLCVPLFLLLYFMNLINIYIKICLF